MALVEVQVPDIGDLDEVTVIELMVKVGDTVKAEQSLITVESDKASMEIPSSTAGVVKEMRIALGDKVKQGSVVLVVEAAGASAAPAAAPAAAVSASAPAPVAAPLAAAAPAASGLVQVHVPNIGDFKDVAVIEVMVKPGDTIKPSNHSSLSNPTRPRWKYRPHTRACSKSSKSKWAIRSILVTCWPFWKAPWLQLQLHLRR